MSSPLARLNIPSTLVIGGGAARQVGAEARRLRLRRPLVVTDPFLQKTGPPENSEGRFFRVAQSPTVWGCGVPPGNNLGMPMRKAQRAAIMQRSAAALKTKT